MRVLVFSAHPDDAEFGLGGTLLRLAKAHAITQVCVTNGGAGSHGSASEREKEQEAAAAILKSKLVRLHKPDCSVEYTRAFALELAQIIRNEKPDIIFAPHWDQQGGVHDGKAHPDHRHLGLAVRDAARFARFRITQLTGEIHDTRHLWWFMTPDHRVPKLIVPIDSVASELPALWNAHRSQLSLRAGKITEHLMNSRKQTAAAYPSVQYGESIDSDAPIPVDFVQELFS